MNCDTSHVNDFLIAFCSEYKSPELQDFFAKVLNADPHKRPSAREALNHKWLSQGQKERIVLQATKRCLLINENYDSLAEPLTKEH